MSQPLRYKRVCLEEREAELRVSGSTVRPYSHGPLDEGSRPGAWKRVPIRTAEGSHSLLDSKFVPTDSNIRATLKYILQLRVVRTAIASQRASLDDSGDEALANLALGVITNVEAI